MSNVRSPVVASIENLARSAPPVSENVIVSAGRSASLAVTVVTALMLSMIVLQAKFAAAVARAPEGLVEPLRACYELYALSRLEAGSGWLLEREFIDSGKSKAIRALAIARCSRVRELALPLVDAFAVPEPVLPEIARGS